jgi:hypothetical protein
MSIEEYIARTNSDWANEGSGYQMYRVWYSRRAGHKEFMFQGGKSQAEAEDLAQDHFDNRDEHNRQHHGHAKVIRTTPVAKSVDAQAPKATFGDWLRNLFR